MVSTSRSVTSTNLAGELERAGPSRPRRSRSHKLHTQVIPDEDVRSVRSRDEDSDIPKGQKKLQGKAVQPEGSRRSAVNKEIESSNGWVKILQPVAQDPTARVDGLKTARVDDLKTARVDDLKTARVDDLKTAQVDDLKTARVNDLKTAQVDDLKTARVDDLKTGWLED
ncbi:unnamed protein product [Cuscuta campestris]|uniref:Uncharacterized protein n=1 Tax=Cuscuta campestris TaxID=132261 RepID=A0A484N8C5_9ASTE|nr:unnamed protein product [Cuscuta campestris]